MSRSISGRAMKSSGIISWKRGGSWSSRGEKRRSKNRSALRGRRVRDSCSARYRLVFGSRSARDSVARFVILCSCMQKSLMSALSFSSVSTKLPSYHTHSLTNLFVRSFVHSFIVSFILCSLLVPPLHSHFLLSKSTHYFCRQNFGGDELSTQQLTLVKKAMKSKVGKGRRIDR